MSFDLTCTVVYLFVLFCDEDCVDMEGGAGGGEEHNYGNTIVGRIILNIVIHDYNSTNL